MIFSRTDSYTGVMIDDLVTRGVTEPYRMFTSRAEYRLKLRADNADQRLTPLGASLGCIGPDRAQAFMSKSTALDDATTQLESLSLTPNEAARHGITLNQDGRRRTAFDLLSYPEIGIERLAAVWPEIGSIDPRIAAQVGVDARYRAYVERQEADVAALKRDEATPLDPDMDFDAVSGLSAELRQKLAQHRPLTLAQAARIDGMTPAALLLLRAIARKRPQQSKIETA